MMLFQRILNIFFANTLKCKTEIGVIL